MKPTFINHSLITILSFVLLGCGGGGGGGGGSGENFSNNSETDNSSSLSAFQLTQISPKNGSVELTWTKSTGATSYEINYGLTPGVYTNQQNQAASNNNPITTSVNNLNNGFLYYFMVKAKNTNSTRLAASEMSVRPMYQPSLSYQCIRNFYVATTGNDANNGTNPTNAYKTINAASNRTGLQAGDCINVLPGTYQESVNLLKGGNAASSTGYVTIRSTVPHAAKIIAPSNTYAAISIQNNYIIIDSLDIQGALGPAIDGCAIQGNHHIAALNNIAHHSGGSGISMCWGDYYHIEGNVVHHNASTNLYQMSGISVYEAQKFDNAPGFHIKVRNNVSFANQILFDCVANNLPAQCHTDGNGIIIDDFHNSQANGNGINYSAETLVENNLVFNNGGSGIAIFLSDNVTIRNNTAYFNSIDPQNGGTWRAEMSNSFSANNLWVNNIAVANPSINSNNVAYQNVANNGYINPGVQWQHNLAYDGGLGTNLKRVQNTGNFSVTTGNPLFINPSIDVNKANFQLETSSPAYGTGSITSNLDNINGQLRSTTNAHNLGAY